MTIQSVHLFDRYWKQAVIVLLALVYIVVNAFRIGGDTFIFSLNTAIVPPIAIGTVILAIGLWRQSTEGTVNRLLWLGLTIGWGLWALAETLWAIAAIIGQEIPYPSWADFFWLMGYIPMYIALWMRIRPLPNISHPWRRIGVWTVSLVSLSWTIFFVLIPIIKSNDPTAIFESILSITYPLADLILLLLVLRIFFTFQRGMYGQAWVWLSLGFILFAVGDLVFAYADTAGLYYPDQKANIISTLGIDVPYNLSYLMCCIGLLFLRNIQHTHQPILEEQTREVSLVPNTHVLVFTKGDDTIIDVSQNFSRVWSQVSVNGKRIAEALGISPDDENTILNGIRTNETLQEQRFNTAALSQQKEICISGIAVISPDNTYSGATLLVRLYSTDNSLDETFNDHEKGTLRMLMRTTGTEQIEQAEIKRLFSSYYQPFLRGIYNRIFSEGGSGAVDSFVAELQTVAKQQGLQMDLPQDLLPDTNHLATAEVKSAFRALFETARQYLIHLTDERSTVALIEEIRSKLGQAAQENVSHFESMDL